MNRFTVEHLNFTR